MTSPGAVITRADAGELYVLFRTTPTTVQRTELATGVSDVLISDVGVGRGLAWADVAGAPIAVADNAGRILLADLADPGTPAVPLLDGLKRVWAVALARPGTLIAGVGDEVWLVDLPTAPDVLLEMPSAPLYLSSWATIGIASTSVNPEDLVFRVEPPEGGLVSHSRDATFGDRPAVLLAASAIPGSYKLIAHHLATGDELAGGEFTVTDQWSGVDGPPASYVGSIGADAPDPAWGGGDPFVPRTSTSSPVLGDRHVAVAIAETSDSTALSAADQGTLRTAWQAEVFDGVLRNGVLESARRYWNDVSDKPDGPGERRGGRPDPADRQLGDLRQRREHRHRADRRDGRRSVEPWSPTSGAQNDAAAAAGHRRSSTCLPWTRSCWWCARCRPAE